MSDFSPTDRTRLRRSPERGAYDRAALLAVLDAALVAHIGYVVDGQPYVTPTCFWRQGDRLFWHGSPAGRMLKAQAQGLPVCLTVTHLDGLVLARSAFDHSINYRSAMVFGTARPLPEADRPAALAAFMERLCPGRQGPARPASPAELRQTTVMVLDLEEAVVKVRSGPVKDDPADRDREVWAGVVPLAIRVGALEPDPGSAPGAPGPEPWAGAAGRRLDEVLGAIALGQERS